MAQSGGRRSDRRCGCHRGGGGRVADRRHSCSCRTPAASSTASRIPTRSSARLRQRDRGAPRGRGATLEARSARRRRRQRRAVPADLRRHRRVQRDRRHPAAHQHLRDARRRAEERARHAARHRPEAQPTRARLRHGRRDLLADLGRGGRGRRASASAGLSWSSRKAIFNQDDERLPARSRVLVEAEQPHPRLRHRGEHLVGHRVGHEHAPRAPERDPRHPRHRGSAGHRTPAYPVDDLRRARRRARRLAVPIRARQRRMVRSVRRCADRRVLGDHPAAPVPAGAFRRPHRLRDCAALGHRRCSR